MMKTILITGASSGIGESLAIEWSKKLKGEATIILAARTRGKLEQVRVECEKAGARAVVIEMDLADSVSVERAAKEMQSQFPAIDIVVHNGGISQRSLAKETKMEVHRRLMDVNYFGAVQLTQLLLPKMLERRSGRFVVISSVMGKIGTPLRTGYAASKHALHGYFDCLRAETADQGVEVTMICPGFIRTPITLNSLTGDGSPNGVMAEAQKKGMDPGVFSRKVIAAVECGAKEKVIGGKEVVGVYLKRFFPALLYKAVTKIKTA